MTVPATPRRAGPYNGNGSTVLFPFAFKVFTSADVAVKASTAGVETVLVEGSDYVVALNADQDALPGGTVAATSPPPGGTTWVIVGATALDQSTDLPTGGKYQAVVVENALDKLAIVDQQLAEQLDRALTLPATAASADTQLPVPVAGNVIGWNDTATGLRNINPSTLASIAAYANRRVLVANGGAATYTLAVDPGGANNCLVAVSGVVQTPGVDYTVSGLVLTPASAWPAGTGNVVIVYGESLPVGVADASMVSFDQSVALDPTTVAWQAARFIHVDGYPYLAGSSSLTPTQRVAAIEAARDRALALGVPLVFGGREYVIETAIRYRSGCAWHFAGIDVTVFRLSDTAVEEANVIEPYSFDGSVSNVSLTGGFTVDGNYARGTVSGVGDFRPGSSGFVTGGAKHVHIVGGIKAKNCVLHGVDICNGGELDSGVRRYVTVAHEVAGYYPSNESEYVFIDEILSENAGDDAVTGHYSKKVFIGSVVASSTGGRHPSAIAANCFEIDDGCREWYVNSVRATGGNRAVSIKSHSPIAAPSDVQIGKIHASYARTGLYIDGSGYPSYAEGQRINIGEVIVTYPSGDFANAASTVEYNAVRITAAKGVSIESITAMATGAEAITLAQAVRFDSNVVDCYVGSIVAENWPYNNTADTTTGAVQLSSTCSDITILSVRLKNCGWRGVLDTGCVRAAFGTIAARLTSSLPGSIGVRVSVAPETTQSTFGQPIVTGYGTRMSVDSLTFTSDTSINRGAVFSGGMVNIGATPIKTVAAGAITIGDNSYIRVSGEGGVDDDLVTINGGKEGDILILRATLANVTITVKHGTGNIYLNGLADFALDNSRDNLCLICNSVGEWTEFGRGNNLN